MKYRLILSLSLLFLVGQAYAGQSLSMQDAIKLGLQNSKQLKIAAARVREAEERYKQSRERIIPDVGVSAMYMMLNEPDVDLKFNQGNQGSSDQGGGITPPKSVMLGQVNASWPLFNGLKTHYNIQQSKLIYKAAQSNEDLQEDEVIYTIAESYINLHKIKATEQVLKEELSSTKQRLKETESLERNGMITRNDLLKLEFRISQLELGLLDVQSKRELANYTLVILTALPDTAQIETSLPVLNLTASDAAVYYQQQAIENRSDLKTAELQKQAAHAGTQAAKSGYYPSLNLSAGYIALDAPDFITVSNAINAGVSLKYSLSGILNTKHQVNEKKANESISTFQYESMIDQAKLKVMKSYNDYQNGSKKIDVYEKALDQATENDRLYHKRFDEQIVLMSDVLDADNDLLSAKIDLENAKSDLSLNYLKLLQETGLLSTYYKN